MIDTITNQLITCLDESHARFFEGEKPGEDRDFFEQMKKEADPIFHLLDQWEEGTLSLIQQQKTNLYPQQISSTKENMQAVILHSFYKDTRKRRFIEMYKSCYYIFTQLKKELAYVYSGRTN